MIFRAKVGRAFGRVWATFRDFEENPIKKLIFVGSAFNSVWSTFFDENRKEKLSLGMAFNGVSATSCFS